MQIFSSLIILFLYFHPLEAKTLEGIVVSIHDGDTISVKIVGTIKPSKVRFMGVDTPEVDFNGFSQGEMAFKAKAFLESLLPIGANINIELGEKTADSNGRYLGRIIYQNQDINLEILKRGLGAMYFIYPYDKKILNEYSENSELASMEEIGIFAPENKNVLLPYMFRQKTKGVPGTNIVGDFKTKKLYPAEKIDVVPSFNRVFFNDLSVAQAHGFTL